MRIFIPSMRRENLQFTVNSLSQESPFPITVVCPFNEYDNYARVLLGRKNVGVLSPPQTIERIAPTRQWIMQKARDMGIEKVVMMDDDLTFARRREDEPDKFRECQSGEISHMLLSLSNLLQAYTHASIATREGGNRDTEDITTCKRVTRVIGYDVRTFFREGVDFRNSTVMDDFEATLHLLTRGHENAILNEFVQNQKGSGTAGGASSYRDMAMQEAAAHKLAERYPQFVKTVRKQTKTAWGGQERTDVIIQWKKALAYGRSTMV